MGHMLHYFHHGNKNKKNSNGNIFSSNLVTSVYFVNYLKLQMAEFLKEIFSFCFIYLLLTFLLSLQFTKTETMENISKNLTKMSPFRVMVDIFQSFEPIVDMFQSCEPLCVSYTFPLFMRCR